MSLGEQNRTTVPTEIEPFETGMERARRLLGFLSAAAFVIAAGVSVLSSRPDRFQVAAIFAVLGTLMSGLWLVFASRIAVDQDGITWKRPLHAPVVIRWEEIAAIKDRRFMQDLVVTTSDGRRIRIDEQLGRFRDVYDLLCARVPVHLPGPGDLPWPLRCSHGFFPWCQVGLLVVLASVMGTVGVMGVVSLREPLMGGAAIAFACVFLAASNRIQVGYEFDDEAIRVRFPVGQRCFAVASLRSLDRSVIYNNGVPFELLELQFEEKKVIVSGVALDPALHLVSRCLANKYGARLSAR